MSPKERLIRASIVRGSGLTNEYENFNGGPSPALYLDHECTMGWIMDIRPILNIGRLVLVFLLILFVVFSRTSMLRDNPLSGLLG